MNIYKWFHANTGFLISLLCLSLIANILLVIFFQQKRTLIVKPNAVVLGGVEQAIPLSYNESTIRFISDAIDSKKDTVFTHININSLVAKSLIDNSEISLLQNEKLEYPKAICYANKPTNQSNYFKVRVSLVGACVRPKNFVINDLEYTDQCFIFRRDSLFMEKFVPLNSNGELKFISRFYSAGDLNCSYKLKIKLFDSNNRVIAKYPKDKEFDEGTIPSLARDITKSGSLLLPQSLAPQITTQPTTNSVLVQ